jgi:hypothetical protein
MRLRQRQRQRRRGSAGKAKPVRVCQHTATRALPLARVGTRGGGYSGKKNKDSKKNVSSNVRIDGFENTDANL